MTPQVIDAMPSRAEDAGIDDAPDGSGHGGRGGREERDAMTTTTTTPSFPHAGGAAAPAIRPTRFLRAAWLVDAAGSAATGLAMGALAAPLAGWTGLAAPALVGAAVLFVPYVALLVALGRRATVARAAARAPVALNAAWGATCLAVAATQAPTALGLAFLAVHVAWGFGFAALQAIGLRRAPAA
jgi:hypothetical protein